MARAALEWYVAYVVSPSHVLLVAQNAIPVEVGRDRVHDADVRVGHGFGHWSHVTRILAGGTDRSLRLAHALAGVAVPFARATGRTLVEGPRSMRPTSGKPGGRMVRRVRPPDVPRVLDPGARRELR